MRIHVATGQEAYPVVAMYPDDEGSDVPDELWQAYRDAVAALDTAERAILDHLGIEGNE